jgi:hypothetical protein
MIKGEDMQIMVLYLLQDKTKLKTATSVEKLWLLICAFFNLILLESDYKNK